MVIKNNKKDIDIAVISLSFPQLYRFIIKK